MLPRKVLSECRSGTITDGTPSERVHLVSIGHLKTKAPKARLPEKPGFSSVAG